MDQGDLRVSDQDRELTAAAIRTHFAAGRLDTAELDERLTAAYRARVRSELDALLADLPTLPPSLVEQRVALAERRERLRTLGLQEVSGGAGTAVFFTAIWAFTGAGFFWPGFIIAIMLIPLLKGGWDLYSPWGDLDRLEAELDTKARAKPALPETSSGSTSAPGHSGTAAEPGTPDGGVLDR